MADRLAKDLIADNGTVLDFGQFDPLVGKIQFDIAVDIIGSI